MLTNQRRVSVDQSERRSSKLDQSEPSSQNAMRGTDGIKGTVPSFLPFPSNTQSRNDVDLCMKLEELSKNTSASVRGNTSSAISPRCNQGTFDSGATYRQYSTNHSGAPSIQRTTVNNNNIRYACTYLSPLRRSISILSRHTTTFRQSRATTYRPYMYDMQKVVHQTRSLAATREPVQTKTVHLRCLP